MTIKQIGGLLIGELNAATIVNDEGVVYIGMGPVSDSEGEEVLAIDEIEACALHEWLGRALVGKRHDIRCRMFPDPFDEREPKGPCNCADFGPRFPADGEVAK